MKQALISALVAAVVAILAVGLAGTLGDGSADAVANARVLSFTMEGIEDSIVNGERYNGVYSQLLTHSDNSICYLTRVQFKAMQAPEDSNICSIELDEFTGHWQVSATVEEGGGSEARCNARCLVWE